MTMVDSITGTIPSRRSSATKKAAVFSVLAFVFAGCQNTMLLNAVQKNVADAAVAPAPSLKAVAPQISVSSGTYHKDQSVTISPVTPGASVYFTLDGTTPTSSSSPFVVGTTDPIALAGSVSASKVFTVKAISTKTGLTDSDVATSQIVINYPKLTVIGDGNSSSPSPSATLTAAPGAATTITDGTPTGTYQFNGWTVTAGQPSWAILANSSLASTTVTLTGDGDVTVTSNHILPGIVSTPLISLPTGTYSSDKTVTLSDSIVGATIWYTVDGSDPTTSGTRLSSTANVNISIDNDGTSIKIWAYATKAGWTDSDAVTSTITIQYQQVADPVLSLTSNTYSANQSLTISDATPGAQIYYTTNGDTPTTASTLYAGAISVQGNNTNETVKAIAVHSQMIDSNMLSVTISIVYPQASAPTFNVASGYTTPSAFYVTLSSTSPGTSFKYSINGGASWTTGSSTVHVISSETVLAITTGGLFSDSNQSTATYTVITVPVVTGSSSNNGSTAVNSMSWPAVTGATSYPITRDGVTVQNTSATSYTDSTTSLYGSQHNYTVSAYCANGSTSPRGLALTFYQQIPTSIFSVTGGSTIAEGASITFNDTYGSLTYRYTKTAGSTGTTPTSSSTSGTSCAWSQSLGSPFTVEVYATRSGYADSQVATATYTTQLPSPTWDGKVYTSSGTVDTAANPGSSPYNLNGRHIIGMTAGSYTPAGVIYYYTSGASATAPTLSSSHTTSPGTLIQVATSGAYDYYVEVSEYVSGWGLSDPLVYGYTNAGVN